MTFHGIFSAVLVPICLIFVSAAQKSTPTPTTRSATTATRSAVATRHAGTNSSGKADVGMLNGFGGVDSSMIQRALYVLIAITVLGVLYFLIRAVRLKKPAQRKKYGLLSNYDDSVEMEAVESEEDDTLYEARSLRRSEMSRAASYLVDGESVDIS